VLAPGSFAYVQAADLPAGVEFTSAEVVYGVTDPDVTVLPEYGVSP
jgi:hypothetical protein